MDEKPSDIEVIEALLAAAPQLRKLHDALLAAHPSLRDNRSLPGAFVGYGIAGLVMSGMTNAQIVERVLEVAAGARQQFRDSFLQGPVETAVPFS